MARLQGRITVSIPDAQGNGIVTDDRLYQLIRQKGPVTDHIFVIEFLDPEVQAFPSRSDNDNYRLCGSLFWSSMK